MAAPLQLTPSTTDAAEAQRWFEDCRPAGVEGLVVKGAASPYRPGRRDWLKVKNRQTEEVIVGGVLGELRRPDAVVAELFPARCALCASAKTSTPRPAQPRLDPVSANRRSLAA